jgi:hypothetical protein
MPLRNPSRHRTLDVSPALVLAAFAASNQTSSPSLRQAGSHLIVRCGQCQTTITVHKGEDYGSGLLRRIERDLEPCLAKGWLKR